MTDQERRRRSYFPAASATYRGININARPDPNAVNSTPQGQTLIPSRYGTSSAVLPPDQNPAYQAAIAKGRPNMNDYTWITTPSGGQMRVPTASLGNLLKPGTSLTGSQVTQIGNQAPIDRAAAYAKGYGAPTPAIQNFAGGPALVQGGVANPASNLSPQQRVQYGVGGVLDSLRTNPSLTAAASFFGGVGRNVASWFNQPALPSIPSTANAAQPSPTPFQTPVPSPTASPTPSPTASAAAPQMFTPPIPGRMFGGQQIYDPAAMTPRRYSDLGYY